jgi:hypothetical protein
VQNTAPALADDTTWIQMALDRAAIAGRQAVQLGPGYHEVSKTITAPPGVYIVGNETHITWTGEGNATMFLWEDQS